MVLLALFERVGRIITPSAAVWTARRTTLAALVEEDRYELCAVKRSFIEAGGLISRSSTNLARIKRAFDFKYARPFPNEREELRGARVVRPRAASAPG